MEEDVRGKPLRIILKDGSIDFLANCKKNESGVSARWGDERLDSVEGCAS